MLLGTPFSLPKKSTYTRVYTVHDKYKLAYFFTIFDADFISVTSILKRYCFHYISTMCSHRGKSHLYINIIIIIEVHNMIPVNVYNKMLYMYKQTG